MCIARQPFPTKTFVKQENNRSHSIPKKRTQLTFQSHTKKVGRKNLSASRTSHTIYQIVRSVCFFCCCCYLSESGNVRTTHTHTQKVRTPEKKRQPEDTPSAGAAAAAITTATCNYGWMMRCEVCVFELENSTSTSTFDFDIGIGAVSKREEEKHASSIYTLSSVCAQHTGNI